MTKSILSARFHFGRSARPVPYYLVAPTPTATFGFPPFEDVQGEVRSIAVDGTPGHFRNGVPVKSETAGCHRRSTTAPIVDRRPPDTTEQHESER